MAALAAFDLDVPTRRSSPGKVLASAARALQLIGVIVGFRVCRSRRHGPIVTSGR